jgi:hypothetical protein
MLGNLQINKLNSIDLMVAGATADCKSRTGIRCSSDKMCVTLCLQKNIIVASSAATAPACGAYAPETEPLCWENPATEKEMPDSEVAGCLLID